MTSATVHLILLIPLMYREWCDYILRPSPLQVSDLPRVDVIVISHSHYDHLDLLTVQALHKTQPNSLFCVPLGMKKWFAGVIGEEGTRNSVVEMDWGEEIVLTHDAISDRTCNNTDGQEVTHVDADRPGETKLNANVPLTVVCVPCQHWCKRTFTDLNTMLWSSWICKTVPSLL